MNSSQNPTQLTLKQKIFVLSLAIVIVLSVSVLLLRKKRMIEQQMYEDSMASNVQKESDVIQTSIKNYCQIDWEKYCKAHTGVDAYNCLKEVVTKLEPPCKFFISGEQ